MELHGTSGIAGASEYGFSRLWETCPVVVKKCLSARTRPMRLADMSTNSAIRLLVDDACGPMISGHSGGAADQVPSFLRMWLRSLANVSRNSFAGTRRKVARR